MDQARSSALPASWEVPELFRTRLGASVGRQRAMVAEGHLLLVLHAAPSAGEDERRGRLFWRSPEGEWRTSGGVRSIAAHLGEYNVRINELEDEEIAAHNSDAYFGVVRRVIPLQRAASNLLDAIQSARELAPEIKELVDFRDRAYQLSRQADLLYQTAKEGLDFEVAHQSERLARISFEMSRSSHRLNILVAFFFPIATLSAIYGVNLEHGWENTPGPWPFATLIAAGLIFGFLLTVFIVRGPRER